MYKYLLDKNKNQFYPLIDDKSIVNVNTINDAQLDEIFNPMVEDILIEDEYRFSVGQYPSASIGVECLPERAGRQAYLDVTVSNPDCCSVISIDGSTIVLNAARRGESTITITETNSGLSKEARVFIQSIPRLYVNSLGPLYVSADMLQESFDEAVYRVEAWSNASEYHQFSHWSDGSTENPREITIYEDTELIAHYKPILYKIEVRSSNNDWGTVRGGGSVRHGSEIAIKAIPNIGYRFVQWSNGWTNPEVRTSVYNDKVFEAIFEELSPNQVIYYTSNDDQTVNPNAYNFGANLVENTYTNGQGMMIFDGGVTTIGDSVFTARTSLTSVTIPNSVTSIGGYAFSNCSSLTSLTIPSSVTSIGNAAFYYCSSLTSITIGNSVTSIGDYAFEGCSSLASVTIPESVTSIGDQAFYGCSSLTTITIPNSVTSIGGSAFQFCDSLTSVIIPNSVTSIGKQAFYGCSSLNSITIGNSMTSIGNSAFYECSSLKTITCEAITPPTLDSGNDLSNVTAVYVPAESVEDYKNATNWVYYADKIQPIPS